MTTNLIDALRPTARRLAAIGALALLTFGTSACYDDDEARRFAEEWEATSVPDDPSSMPDLMLGAWRQSDAELVTEDECRQGPDHAANLGQVMVIDDNGYAVFEEGGTLTTVHERTGGGYIDASFDTSVGDSAFEERLVFELDYFDVLLVERHGPGDAPAEVTRYVRCPPDVS